MTLNIKDLRFSVPNDPRPSLFGSSVKTESTNMTSASNVTMGANGDFTNFCTSFGRRTSIQFDFKSSTVVTIPEFNVTGKPQHEEFKEDSEEEILERVSLDSLNQRVSLNEGQPNAPNDLNIKSKSEAVVNTPNGISTPSPEGRHNDSGAKRERELTMRAQISQIENEEEFNSSIPFLSEE